jgi:putative hydrolase of the HAD superfamily
MSESKSQGKIQVRAVVFDYGNVLSLDQAPGAAAKMAQLCGLADDVFAERYWQRRLDYDRGDLDGKSYWESVVRERADLLTPNALEELYSADGEGWGRPNLSMLSWVEQLRGAGIRVAVLSNMPLEVSVFLTKNREWLSGYDPLIFSCYVRRVKPEEAIYRHCIERVGLAPGEVLFLDDKQFNVEAARRCGMHSLVFESVAKTLPLVRDQFDLPMPDAVMSLA